MAALTITVSNQLNLLGPSESTKWGEFNWGEENWGWILDLQVTVFKVLSETQSFSQSITKTSNKALTGSISSDMEMTSGGLTDSNIWYYEFVSETSELDDRDFATWTEQTNSGSWTESSDPSTSWSET